MFKASLLPSPIVVNIKHTICELLVWLQVLYIFNSWLSFYKYLASCLLGSYYSNVHVQAVDEGLEICYWPSGGVVEKGGCECTLIQWNLQILYNWI